MTYRLNKKDKILLTELVDKYNVEKKSHAPGDLKAL